MAVSPTHNGWHFDAINSRLDFYYRGTRVGHITAAGLSTTAALAATTTVTSGTAMTVTAGDMKDTLGNLRLGVINTFVTTEPTLAVIMKVGTAPAGAITTSGGIFTDGTNMMKIVAGSTADNIET